ncbi:MULTISPECIES: MazG nucleotide pyrophosphohydrolase domain-containing protein [unclassified Nonomuraea]|uniref:MazG nucleotide pyrophosphohydrolase domain-containing protein n=1 Tax=unclassified Nonomuraea TaxID=2593643 RepID=UPI0033D386C2
MHLRDVQKRAWENKLAKGFNTSDMPLEFALAHGELSEAFEAARKRPETLGEELADVLIFLASIAEMSGIDLDSAVETKMAKNEARRYERGPNGTLIKIGEQNQQG